MRRPKTIISSWKVTDNVLVHSPIIASNWELSALRAARVARPFEDAKSTKQQFAIQGWGEAKPLAPNVNADGTDNAANQARNRRVHIRVYQFTSNKIHEMFQTLEHYFFLRIPIWRLSFEYERTLT